MFTLGRFVKGKKMAGTSGAPNAYGAGGLWGFSGNSGGKYLTFDGGRYGDAGDANQRYAVDAQSANAAADRASKNSRFNAIFGQLRGMFGQGGFATAGGQSGPGPEIDAGPIWNPQQIDQGVNALRAQNDASAESRIRELRAGTAGRGFGSNSPLLQALTSGVHNATMATNTEAERAFRQQASEGNAGQVLKGQAAREQQFASRQDEDIRRRQPYFAQQNALIAALAGLA